MSQEYVLPLTGILIQNGSFTVYGRFMNTGESLESFHRAALRGEKSISLFKFLNLLEEANECEIIPIFIGRSEILKS